MFSGIVQQVVIIHQVNDLPGCRQILLKIPELVEKIKVGDSVSVNGVCLTVTTIKNDMVSFDVVPQTLAVTNLARLKANDPVNLELSINYGDPIGGHMVQGHVDQTVKVLSLEKTGDSLRVKFELPKALKPYIIDKGYVALDGMSITIQRIEQDAFYIALIPHTQQVTISQHYQQGSEVNIEVDMNAKYIKQIIENQNASNR